MHGRLYGRGFDILAVDMRARDGNVLTQYRSHGSSINNPARGDTHRERERQRERIDSDVSIDDTRY